MTAEQLTRAALLAAFPHVDPDAVLEGWEIVPFEQNGELTAAGCIKGTEFHLTTTERFKLRRAEMREGLRPLFERHGHLTTRVAHSDTANQRFNQLFGFRRTWSDHTYHYFLMAELPFAPKENSCQQ